MRRILVADGETDAVANTAFILAGAGYRVSTVQTADEMLLALGREHYDLIVLSPSILRLSASAPIESPCIFRFGELCIDFTGHYVMVDDEIIALTRKEFSLLRTLAENAGQLCTRSLLRGADDETSRTPSRTIDMHVSRLRRKLGTAGEMIEQVRGEGYRLKMAPSNGHS